MQMSFILKSQRDALASERDELLDVEKPEDLTPEAAARVKEINAELRGLDGDIDDAEKAEGDETEARKATARSAVQVVSEANPVYRKGGETSYFRDLFLAETGRAGAPEARERLAQSQARDVSGSTVSGAGTFAPPLWLVDQYVTYARPARVTADLLVKETLPGGVSSINIPRVSTPTTVAVQATNNASLSSQVLAADSVSSSITTTGGQAVVSMQLIEQSGIPFDDIILRDLTAAHAVALDAGVLSGTGSSGQLTGIIPSAGTTLTYTSSSPAFAGAGALYAQINAGISAIASGRYMPPTGIVMHPRRWSWIMSQVDSSNRPLVTPNGAIFNAPGVTDGVYAQGAAGVLAGLPVYLDANIPINTGAGTNQDTVIIAKLDDLYLWETAVDAQAFSATYANQNSMLFRVTNYSAAIPTRYTKSIATITGTGLVTPTF